MRYSLLFLALLATAQEIPDPQFHRPLWQSLNGNFEFEFDDANAGLTENWAGASRKFGKSIVVPYCFESRKSGIGDTRFHPWVWYRRSFSVQEAWAGKRVWLNFGAVDYQAMVWVNGRAAGEHTGGSTRFRFDITPLLKAGENVVTVRAFDPPTDRAIPRGKQYWEPKSRSIFYTRTSGIWQSVWLEAAGASSLAHFRLATALDGTVSWQVRVANPQPELELETVIERDGKTVARAWAGVASQHHTGGTRIDSPTLWTVERPVLYDLTFRLKNGNAVLDEVHSYFGIRTVGVENGRFTLNGRPVYLKFVLDQGYWPESLLTPPSDEALQFDIKATKEMGFNGARKHQKVEDPRYLYWADKLGFLVSSEMPNSYLYDEQYVGRFTQEWTESVLRDVNHPSVVMWAPLNESWGVPDLQDARQQAHLRALYHQTKSLDPTRPVIDNEGWQHTETTDLLAVHDYAASGQALMSRWRGIEAKPGGALPSHSRGYLAPGTKYNGTPLYLSEFGGIAYIPEGARVPAESWGYSGVEKTREAALLRLQGQYMAIETLPFIGICYTQLTDVEQEINGLLTYDRKWKFPAEELRKLNGLLK